MANAQKQCADEGCARPEVYRPEKGCPGLLVLVQLKELVSPQTVPNEQNQALGGSWSSAHNELMYV